MSDLDNSVPFRITTKFFLEAALLLLLFGVFFVQTSKVIEDYPWYTNGDQDANLVQGSLLRNSGLSPEFFHHPSLGSYILLGESLKFARFMNWIPCSDFNCLKNYEDPLLALAKAVQIAKYAHVLGAIVLCMGVYVFLRIFFGLPWSISFGGVCFLLFNGLWIQSVQIRSEFASIVFAWIAAMLILVWDRFAEKKPERKSRNILNALLVLTGVFLGLSLASKIQAFQFVPLVWVFVLFKLDLKRKNYFVFRSAALWNVFFFGVGYVSTLFLVPYFSAVGSNYSDVVEFLFLPFNTSALSAHQYIGFKPRLGLWEKTHYFLNQIFNFYVSYILVFFPLFLMWIYVFRVRKIAASIPFFLLILLLNYAVFFNSLRYYAWHYLAYVDLYVLLACAYLLQYKEFKSFYSRKSYWISSFVCIGTALFIFVSDKNNTTKYSDYNSSYRNIPSWFYHGVAFCKQCQDLWQERYSSPEAFTIKAKELDTKLKQ